MDRGLALGWRSISRAENERFLEYRNLVSCNTTSARRSGLDAHAAAEHRYRSRSESWRRSCRSAPPVFDTDQFAPLIALGEELSGSATEPGFAVDRALRILADHARAMTFLVADGVVPSNEDRGYVLRRVMRRAIRQGRALDLEPGFLEALRRVRARGDGRRLPGAAGAGGRDRHVAGRRGGGLRAHARAGLANAARAIARARGEGSERTRPRTSSSCTTRSVPVRPHEGAAVRGGPRRRRGGLRAADGGAARARPRLRRRQRAGRSRSPRERAREFAEGTAAKSSFTGYETEEQHTTVAAVGVDGERSL